jgi:hypothetical protein
MKHIDRDGIDTYRIGFWTHHWWPRKQILICLLTGKQPSPRADNGKRFVGRRPYVRVILRDLKLIRRPHRPWQAEYENCRWCPRAWTSEGARRKAERDLAYQRNHDLWAPWIQRKVRRRYGDDAIMGPIRTAA